MSEVVFLHGLESSTDASGVPIGGKARFLAEAFDAELVALDTSAARDALARAAARGPVRYPYDGYEDAFRVPMARARAALREDARVVVGSSFGGAVLLRLLHETPGWRGPCLLLAGAGVKLTPYDALPPGTRAILVHGRQDDVVPFEDSVRLAASSEAAELVALDDGHRLSSILHDGALGAWIRRLSASS